MIIDFTLPAEKKEIHLDLKVVMILTMCVLPLNIKSAIELMVVLLENSSQKKVALLTNFVFETIDLYIWRKYWDEIGHLTSNLDSSSMG